MQNNFILNLTTNFITLGLTIVMSLWLTPFIIHNLGVEAFGLVNLTQTLINYLTIITVTLSSMIGRFFTIEFQRGENERAQSYINTYFFSSIFIASILLIILTGLAVFINKIVDVPQYLLFDVRISILVGSLLFVVTFVSSAFSAAPFCMNKLYITNGIQAVNAITRVVIIILLLTVFSPRIWYVNIGNLLAGIVSLLLGIYYFKKLIPWMKVGYEYFDVKKLKDLFNAGIWNSIGQIGVLLFLQIDLLVANLMLGAEMAGKYSAVIQFPLLLRTVATTIAAVFAPIIITHYANNRMDELKYYSNQAVRLNGLILSLPAALLCGAGGALLRVWLGQEFEEMKWLLIINSLYLVIALGVMPLFHIATAVNKLKLPALATLGLGILNLVLAILLSGPAGLGLYGIAIAGAIALVAKNFIFTPIYSAYITQQPIFIYYRGILSPVIGTGFTILLSMWIQSMFYINGWIMLILHIIIVSIIYFCFVLLFLINKRERKNIVVAIKTFVSRKSKTR
ncbi:MULTISPECIES: MATE family efflux transporter [Bacillus cereus group]|uniref:MATE family efflux transporter n=1 Tax=Bacillus cereus group TaxID=86661 RepID=UPI001F0AB073|nr:MULTISPECIES: MATE family efflux transporter [Bacillus cereus group]